jgi:hypothetical protein
MEENSCELTVTVKHHANEHRQQPSPFITIYEGSNSVEEFTEFIAQKVLGNYRDEQKCELRSEIFELLDEENLRDHRTSSQGNHISVYFLKGEEKMGPLTAQKIEPRVRNRHYRHLENNCGLLHAVLELVDNSVEYTKQCKVPRVELIFFVGEGGKTSLLVRDFGSGMDKAALNEAMEINSDNAERTVMVSKQEKMSPEAQSWIPLTGKIGKWGVGMKAAVLKLAATDAKISFYTKTVGSDLLNLAELQVRYFVFVILYVNCRTSHGQWTCVAC